MLIYSKIVIIHKTGKNMRQNAYYKALFIVLNNTSNNNSITTDLSTSNIIGFLVLNFPVNRYILQQ